MDPKLVTPILIGALVVWSVLRRMRRSFGRQPVREARMVLRIVILTVVGGLILATASDTYEEVRLARRRAKPRRRPRPQPRVPVEVEAELDERRAA